MRRIIYFILITKQEQQVYDNNLPQFPNILLEACGISVDNCQIICDIT